MEQATPTKTLQEEVKEFKEREEKIKPALKKPTIDQDKFGNDFKKFAINQSYDSKVYHHCNTCGNVKEHEYFIKDKGISTGIRRKCKACKNFELREKTLLRKQLKNKESK